MTQSELDELIYPGEQWRYVLALAAVTPLVAGGLVVVYETFGLALIGAPVLLFMAWFVSELIRAEVMGNAVRVSELNFPEIYHALREAKAELGYPGAVDAFVYAEDEINAYLLRLFRRKFLLIPSGIVAQREVAADHEVKWLIARFIGALKSKHGRALPLRLLVDSSENLFVLNLFLYPYERAVQYSGDQIGLAVTKDLGAAVRMMTKFFVGREIAGRVQVRGLLRQADEIHANVFARLVRLLSPFPHLTDRYLNLLAFARSRYTHAFEGYLSGFDAMTRTEILAALPHVHSRPRPAVRRPSR